MGILLPYQLIAETTQLDSSRSLCNELSIDYDCPLSSKIDINMEEEIQESCNKLYVKQLQKRLSQNSILD